MKIIAVLILNTEHIAQSLHAFPQGMFQKNAY